MNMVKISAVTIALVGVLAITEANASKRPYRHSSPNHPVGASILLDHGVGRRIPFYHGSSRIQHPESNLTLRCFHGSC
jgi:hypothetical protein